jgi:VanZ family protein
MRPDPWTYRFAALAIIVAGVAYGSLYPFHFEEPIGGQGPLQAVLRTWDIAPGRGDLLANIVLYLPIGFFCVRIFPARMSEPLRFMLTLLFGTALSGCVELAQYYDPGRVPSAGDVYTNAFGTAVGAVAGIVFAYDIRLSLVREIRARPFPALLLASWLGYRLYPYAPTINLHKYWDALKPLVLNPQLVRYDCFRYAVMWLTIAALLETIAKQRRSRRLLPLFAAAVIAAKITIIAQELTLNEVVGMGAGFAIWLTIIGQPFRVRAFLIVMPLLVYIVLWRLEPFQFDSVARPFGWLPFYSMLNGSLAVNTESYLEKVFYYGSTIWFMAEAGLPIWLGGLTTAALLFATSVAEIYLPMRSAEVTDAVMALISALLASLLTPKSEDFAAQKNPRRVRRPLNQTTRG